jgi:hypothetical protein
MLPSLLSSFSSPPCHRRRLRHSQTDVGAPKSGAMGIIEGMRHRRGHVHEPIFERNRLRINGIKETRMQSVPIAKPRAPRAAMLLLAAAIQRRSPFHLIWPRRSPIRRLRWQKREIQTNPSFTICAYAWQTRCLCKKQKRHRSVAVGQRDELQNGHQSAAREIARKDADLSLPRRLPA